MNKELIQLKTAAPFSGQSLRTLEGLQQVIEKVTNQIKLELQENDVEFKPEKITISFVNNSIIFYRRETEKEAALRLTAAITKEQHEALNFLKQNEKP